MCAGERLCGCARVSRVGVEHHRALATRIVDEAVRDAKLQDVLAFGGVISGFAERVPATKLHGDIVM